MDEETCAADQFQDPLLRAAPYDRADQAYASARPVYNRYAHGLPPRDELPDRERALLDEPERAEAAVKRLGGRGSGAGASGNRLLTRCH